MGVGAVGGHSSASSREPEHGGKKLDSSAQGADLFAALFASFQSTPSGGAIPLSESPSKSALGAGAKQATSEVALSSPLHRRAAGSAMYVGVELSSSKFELQAVSGARGDAHGGSRGEQDVSPHGIADFSQMDLMQPETTSRKTSMSRAEDVDPRAGRGLRSSADALDVASQTYSASMDGIHAGSYAILAVNASPDDGRETFAGHMDAGSQAKLALQGLQLIHSSAASVSRKVEAGNQVANAQGVLETSPTKPHKVEANAQAGGTSAVVPQDSVSAASTNANGLQGTSQSSASTTSSATVDVRDANAASELGTVVATRVEDGNTTLHVQVEPGGMGQLQVIVTQSTSGMHVQVVASQQAALSWLQGQLNDLQQSMQAAGLSVSSLSLTMASDGQAGRGDRENGRSGSRTGSVQASSIRAGVEGRRGSAMPDSDAQLINLYV